MSSREVVGWVAFVDSIAPGGRADDLRVLIERARRLRCTSIALRTGAAGNIDVGSHRNNVPALDLIAAIKDAGMKVKVWHFEYAAHPTASRSILERWVEHADEVIINAEFEYIAASRAQATTLVNDLRAMGFPRVTHAPPDYAGARGDGALAVLDELCDAAYPQVYSFEHDDRGATYHLDAVRSLYLKREATIGLGKVSPIGCTYRPRYRGFDANKRPIPIKAIGDQRVADDVVAFLTHPWTMASECVHLYSIDALTFAGEGGDAVLSAVEAMPSDDWLQKPIVFGDTSEIPNLGDFLASLGENTRRLYA